MRRIAIAVAVLAAVLGTGAAKADPQTTVTVHIADATVFQSSSVQAPAFVAQGKTTIEVAPGLTVLGPAHRDAYDVLCLTDGFWIDVGGGWVAVAVAEGKNVNCIWNAPPPPVEVKPVYRFLEGPQVTPEPTRERVTSVPHYGVPVPTATPLPKFGPCSINLLIPGCIE